MIRFAVELALVLVAAFCALVLIGHLSFSSSSELLTPSFGRQRNRPQIVAVGRCALTSERVPNLLGTFITLRRARNDENSGRGYGSHCAGCAFSPG
jgi:hypothetical protein